MKMWTWNDWSSCSFIGRGRVWAVLPRLACVDRIIFHRICMASRAVYFTFVGSLRVDFGQLLRCSDFWFDSCTLVLLIRLTWPFGRQRIVLMWDPVFHLGFPWNMKFDGGQCWADLHPSDHTVTVAKAGQWTRPGKRKAATGWPPVFCCSR